MTIAEPAEPVATTDGASKPATERLEARDMGCVITSESSSCAVSGFSCRIGVRTMAKDRVAVPVVAAACAVLFFGLGSYLGARPSVDPQQELAALRAEIDLLRKQQEPAPTPLPALRHRLLLVRPPYSITRSAPPSSPMSSVSSRPKWACCP